VGLGVWLVQCDERMVGRHLRRGLGWLVLVAPIRLVVIIVTAFDLRLLQLPRSRGNHRQDEQEGQNKQVKLMHCYNGEGRGRGAVGWGVDWEGERTTRNCEGGLAGVGCRGFFYLLVRQVCEERVGLLKGKIRVRYIKHPDMGNEGCRKSSDNNKSQVQEKRGAKILSARREEMRMVISRREFRGRHG
jgi:hypothetical protein